MPRWTGPLERVDDDHWRIPLSYKPGMPVAGQVITSEETLESVLKE